MMAGDALIQSDGADMINFRARQNRAINRLLLLCPLPHHSPCL
jgi:hypothetical protein